MALNKNILVSVHGRRLGISAAGELILDGKTVAITTGAGGGIVGTVLPPTGIPALPYTLTPANILLNVNLSSAPAAPGTLTLPTAQALIDYINLDPYLKANFSDGGSAIRWTLINYATGAANIITLAPNTGHTIVGSALIPSNDPTTGGSNGTSTARFRTQRTISNTFITYRE